MDGVKLTKIAKKSEQISQFIEITSLTERFGFQKSVRNFSRNSGFLCLLKTSYCQQNEFSVLEIELEDLLLVSDIFRSLSTARNQLIDALGYDKESSQYNAGIEMCLDNFNYAYERSKGQEEKLSVIIGEYFYEIYMCFLTGWVGSILGIFHVILKNR